jgi:hypothetical protein
MTYITLNRADGDRIVGSSVLGQHRTRRETPDSLTVWASATLWNEACGGEMKSGLAIVLAMLQMQMSTVPFRIVQPSRVHGFTGSRVTDRLDVAEIGYLSQVTLRMATSRNKL